MKSGKAGEDPKLIRAAELKRVSFIFLDGFDAALTAEGGKIERDIDKLPQIDRGVAFEGAAAAKAVRDLSAENFSTSQTSSLLVESNQYSFLMLLGIGEALAQLKMPPQICNAFANENWSGQIIEGYGFFDGYFNWHEAVIKQRYPDGLGPELMAAYNQGIGRALFFITNGNPQQIRDLIVTFDPVRRAELWAGVGLPTAYIGGHTERELKRLVDLADKYRAEFMQGIMLGASARNQQSYIPEHTELAASVVYGSSALKAVDFTNNLTKLVLERESHTMHDWQHLVRRELRRDAC